MKVAWIKELDEDMFKEFILEQYETWLIDFLKIINIRLEDCKDEVAPLHLYRELEVKAEIDKVRGLY